MGLMTWMAMDAALACGGFFCSGGYTNTNTNTITTTTIGTLTGEAPVTQKSERILFRKDALAGTVTTYVEVSYVQNEDVDFAWLIPLPATIRAEDVSTASADLFNALEVATAPRFEFRWIETNTYTTTQNTTQPRGGSQGGYGYGYGYGYGSGRRGAETGRGCDCGGGWEATAKMDTTIPTDLCSDGSPPPCDSYATGYTYPTTTTVVTEVGVEVVAEAVVGPFAVEVIEATDVDDLGVWLEENAYDLPDQARDPLAYYVDMAAQKQTPTGEPVPAAFLGVKLAPDVPTGPIDTLVFTYPSERPMIPIILTAIAVCPDLPIVAYLLSDDPWVPANWTEAESPAEDTELLPDGSIDYVQRLDARIDEHGGHAFVTEYRAPTSVITLGDPALDAILDDGGATLTRLRGSISPWEMTEDPEFMPSVGAPMVGREHEIWIDAPPERRRERGARGAWLLLPLVALLRRRRGWWAQ